ncbi:hypothetical protein CVT24_009987 [Panaeolus cyanescens]|uniref:F-box domain-containing protein n=1 Tax=Panaeolus cyanescens TaxID=181874 RepID=A0A409WW92_9AGAR|nr:hypothetical protein CVT24_009987 [Panaeolus cyanescens]
MLFTDISPDVLLRISILLDPQDLISLRKTCQTLSSLSHEKTLWLQLADRLCTENLLFPSVFPLHNLGSAVLEDIATHPVRWEKLMLQQREITPVSVRRISTPSAFGYYNFLVPGGRFLFSSYESPPRLVLLDLCSENPAMPIATLVIKSDASFNFIPSPSKRTLSVSVHTPIYTPAIRYLIHVYDISPYENDCQFTKVASSDPRIACPSSGPIALSPDTMVFTQDCQLTTIWKYRTDEWMRCTVSSRAVFKVFLLHDSIILMHPNTLSVCLIPTTNYVSRLQALQSPPAVELRILYEREFSPPQYPGCKQAIDDWYSGSRHQTMTVVQISNPPSMPDDMVLFHFYNIEHDEDLSSLSSSSSREARIPPNQSWATVQAHRDRSSSVFRWIPCNNGIYRITHSRLDVAHFHCQGLKNLDDGTVQTSNVVIDIRNAIPDIPDDAKAKILLCPQSGRACLYYTSPGLGSNSPGAGVIFVLDFFEPLPVLASEG